MKPAVARSSVARLMTCCCSISAVFLTAASAALAPAHTAHDGLAFAPRAPLVRGLQRVTASARTPLLSRRASPPAVLGLRASMRDYRKGLLHDKVGRLEKLSQQVFNLQDILLQIAVVEEDIEQRVVVGPSELNPKQTAVIGTGPAGLATAIMLARYSTLLFALLSLSRNRLLIKACFLNITGGDGTTLCSTTDFRRRRARIQVNGATQRCLCVFGVC